MSGKSSFPLDYTLIDLETTGLSATQEEIVEFGALRVRDNRIVTGFSELSRPSRKGYDPSKCKRYNALQDERGVYFYISDFISSITHIDNVMLSTARAEKEVLKDFLDFIGDDLLLGQNVSFDYNFIKNRSEMLLNICFSREKKDTLYLSKKILPQLKRHRLQDLADYYEIDYRKAHRAMEDCYITKKVYDFLKIDALDLYQTEDISCQKHLKIEAPKDIKRVGDALKRANVVLTMFENPKLKKKIMTEILKEGGEIQPFVDSETDRLIVGSSQEKTGLYYQAVRRGVKIVHFDEK